MLRKVSPGLKIGDKGSEVVNLRDVLQLLVDKAKLTTDRLRGNFCGLADERQVFGDYGTFPLVGMFPAYTFPL